MTCFAYQSPTGFVENNSTLSNCTGYWLSKANTPYISEIEPNLLSEALGAGFAIGLVLFFAVLKFKILLNFIKNG